jgi:hypothetical protein
MFYSQTIPALYPGLIWFALAISWLGTNSTDIPNNVHKNHDEWDCDECNTRGILTGRLSLPESV